MEQITKGEPVRLAHVLRWTNISNLGAPSPRYDNDTRWSSSTWKPKYVNAPLMYSIGTIVRSSSIPSQGPSIIDVLMVYLFGLKVYSYVFEKWFGPMFVLSLFDISLRSPSTISDA